MCFIVLSPTIRIMVGVLSFSWDKGMIKHDLRVKTGIFSLVMESFDYG